MNKTLMLDLYELTMAQTYFNDSLDTVAYFDGFFRKNPFGGGYGIMAGVDDIIRYIKSLKFKQEDIEYLRELNLFSDEFLIYLSNFKFNGDIWLVKDGTVIFANEPLIVVRANIIEAQIIETAVLSYLNSCIKFATSAKRMVEAAGDIPVMEFGARRADGPEAAILASKCAYISGCVGTSNVLAGKLYGIPVLGTMAHSMVSFEEDEYSAFLKYAKTFPDSTIFLIDTYDTLKSGIYNAIKVAKDYLIPNGFRLKGVRIDSGDLAYLSKRVRSILDAYDMKDCKIYISNSIDPYTINSLKMQGAIFDYIGAGDNIVAVKDRVGVVYKLVGIEKDSKFYPKIKLSNDAIKIINPGFKKLYRFYDKNTGFALGDVSTLHDEVISQDKYVLIDPTNEFNTTTITNYFVEELLVKVFENGELIYNRPSIIEIRDRCIKQMKTIYPEIKRLNNPHKYYVDLSRALLDVKKETILSIKEGII